MLTTAPHLRIRRPSPTTVEYTVSTSPSPTLPFYLVLTLTYTLRLLLAFSILFLLYSKYLLSAHATSLDPPEPWPSDILSASTFWYLLAALHHSALGGLFTSAAGAVPVTIVLPAALFGLHILSLRLHTTESLLVLRGLGIQTASSSARIWGGHTTRFIPTEKIQDILVNEAFRGFEVRYYLSVVVEGEEGLVVIFPKLLPRRDVVVAVWRGGRACLFEGVGGEKEEDSGRETEREKEGWKG